MNRHLILTAILALALQGCAGTPAKQPDTKQVADSTCVRDTGTRVKHSGCTGPGATYTQEDLQRTGEINTDDALRKLDPRVTR